MTPFPWLVRAEDPLERAVALMRERDIHHLPVTRDGELVGVVTAREIQIAESLNRGPEPRKPLSVADVSALERYVVDMGQRLDRVLLEMAERRIGSALVTRHGKLAGIFTMTDACRSFGEFLRSLFPESPDDEAA